MIINYLNKLKSITQNEHKKYVDFILNYGCYYNTEIPQESKPEIYFKPQVKECYKNSLLLSISQGYNYVEGYYITKATGIPLEHAFNTNNKGQIIDLTTQINNTEVKQRYGIVIPKQIVKEYLNTNQVLTCLKYYYINHVNKP